MSEWRCAGDARGDKNVTSPSNASSMACASPFNQRVAAEPMIVVLFTSGPYFPFFPVFVRHSPRSLEAPTPFACLTSVAKLANRAVVQLLASCCQHQSAIPTSICSTRVL